MFLSSHSDDILATINMMGDSQLAIAKDAFLALVNLAVDGDIALQLVS